MNKHDFAKFYGVKVMLQFKETISLAVPGEGEPETVPAFSKNGRPRDRNGNEVSDPALMATQRSWPIQPARASSGPNQGQVEFLYVLTDAVVLPVEGSEQIAITYKSHDALIELMIDPESILTCQAIRAREPAERLIAQA